jgi:hypothetical protein
MSENAMNKIQTITTPTGEKMAILPLSDYEALLDAVDAAQALAEAGHPNQARKALLGLEAFASTSPLPC